MHLSGATGSGIIIARLPSGAWGPPAGINVHGLSAGVGAGVAMYDCICVVNTKEGLAQFTQKRMTMGGQVAVAAGPWGGASSGERPDEQAGKEAAAKSEPVPAVYTYTKTKGLYLGIQVDGTVFSQRDSANAAFYGGKVGVEQILKGEVKEQQGEKLWPAAAKGLLGALEVAESH
jgi:SH3 domain-containing YSC84-like protein 1